MIEGNRQERRMPRWPLTSDGTFIVLFGFLTLMLAAWRC